MAVITNTIGSADTYATIQLWDDDGTATTEIETNGNVWEGNMRNEEHSPGATQTIDGHTTTSGAFKRLTALGGAGFESFIDKFTTGTGLDFNANGGARLIQTANGRNGIQISDQFTELTRLQFRTIGNYSTTIRASAFSGGNLLVSKCICDGESAGSSSIIQSHTDGLIVNTLIINRRANANSGQGLSAWYGTKIVNCTSVTPSDVNTGDKGHTQIGGTVTAIHCAVFRFGGTGAFSGTWSGDWNATDDLTGPGANPVDSLTYADQFEDTTADWTLKSGNSLSAAGESTDGDVPSEDILEQSRPSGGSGNPVAIGCIEPLAAAGGDGTDMPWPESIPPYPSKTEVIPY